MTTEIVYDKYPLDKGQWISTERHERAVLHDNHGTFTAYHDENDYLLDDVTDPRVFNTWEEAVMYAEYGDEADEIGVITDVMHTESVS